MTSPEHNSPYPYPPEVPPGLTSDEIFLLESGTYDYSWMSRNDMERDFDEEAANRRLMEEDY